MSFLVADVVTLALILPGNLDIGRVIRPPLDVLWEQNKYGAQGQAANMAALFNYRFDLFLVAAFVSTAGVGQYAVAVGLAESVWWISSAISMVLRAVLDLAGKPGHRPGHPTAARRALGADQVRRAGPGGAHGGARIGSQALLYRAIGVLSCGLKNAPSVHI